MNKTKLFFVFLIIFLFPIFTFASQKDKTIEIKVNDVISEGFLSVGQLQGLEYLIDKGVLSQSNLNENTIVVKNSNGKVLFHCVNTSNYCLRDQNVTDSDNIVYTFSDEEKDLFASSSSIIAKHFSYYDKIVINFTPTITTESDYILDIYDGDATFDLPEYILASIFNNLNDFLGLNYSAKIKNLNNDVLSEMYFSESYASGDSNNLDKYYSYGTTDVVYTFNEDDKHVFSIDGINVSDYDQIVLNYSGNTYDNRTLSIDMKNLDNNPNSNIFKFIMFFTEKKLIKMEMTANLIDKSNNVYGTIIIPSYDEENILTSKITITKDNQFIVNKDSLRINNLLPDNYQRIILKFHKSSESNDNNNNVVPTSKPKDLIINNPKTGMTIMGVCFVIILSAISLVVINLAKNH